MTRLSIAIVCKNNEKTLGAVLASVRTLIDVLGGEIVAVDSGSTDRTIPMLEAAGARIIRSPWLGHVKTKQLALDHCTTPWILCLDSDEPPTDELIRSIIAALDPHTPIPSNTSPISASSLAGYRVNRKIWYRGRFLEHAWQPEWRLRLVRKGRCRWTGEDPHDRMEPIERRDRVADLEGALRHDSFETFAEHLAKQVAHSRTAAASALSAGRTSSPWKLITSPIGAFLKQMVIKQAWRDGIPGWLAAGSTAAGALMKHMVMLEGRPERDRSGG